MHLIWSNPQSLPPNNRRPYRRSRRFWRWLGKISIRTAALVFIFWVWFAPAPAWGHEGRGHRIYFPTIFWVFRCRSELPTVPSSCPHPPGTCEMWDQTQCKQLWKVWRSYKRWFCISIGRQCPTVPGWRSYPEQSRAWTYNQLPEWYFAWWTARLGSAVVGCSSPRRCYPRWWSWNLPVVFIGLPFSMSNKK